MTTTTRTKPRTGTRARTGTGPRAGTRKRKRTRSTTTRRPPPAVRGRRRLRGRGLRRARGPGRRRGRGTRRRSGRRQDHGPGSAAEPAEALPLPWASAPARAVNPVRAGTEGRRRARRAAPAPRGLGALAAAARWRRARRPGAPRRGPDRGWPPRRRPGPARRVLCHRHVHLRRRGRPGDRDGHVRRDGRRITGTGVVEGVGDPSYLAVHPSGRTPVRGGRTRRRCRDRRALDAGGAHQVIGSRPTGGARPAICPCTRPDGCSAPTTAPAASPSTSAASARRVSVRTWSPTPSRRGPGRSARTHHQIVRQPRRRTRARRRPGQRHRHTYRLDTRAGTSRRCRTTLKPGAGPGTSPSTLGPVRLRGERTRQHRRGLRLRPADWGSGRARRSPPAPDPAPVTRPSSW